MRRTIAISLLLVAAIACKAERAYRAADGATDTAARTADAPPPAQPPSPKGATSQSGVPALPPVPRMIIRTAEVSLVVADTQSSIDTISTAAKAAGGYVADSRVWRDHELLRATLTVRVPAPQLDATLAAIRKSAKRVQSETISSDDVSQEYVDLESQVRNLEAAEVEMRQLMTTVRERTEKAQDILDVYQQLTALRGQIEQAKGRMRYLSQTSAMSTVKIELIPDAVAQPVVEPGWQPFVIVKNASRALINTLEIVAAAAIWIVIYLLPIVLGGALVVWMVARVIRRRVRTA